MGLRKTKLLTDLVCYAVLLLMGAFVLVPLLWFVVTSLKPTAAILSFPPRWIPKTVTSRHYATILSNPSIGRYYLNSFIVCLGTILVTLLLGSHIGYAAARVRFRGKNVLLFGILATSMVPAISILPALYIMSLRLSLHDTYLILILVYSAQNIPTVTWIMRGFFESISPELEEAALIDGCTRLQTLYRIIFPLAQPGLASSAILVFINVWNEWLIAQNLTISEHMQVVPVGLYNFIRDIGVEWGSFSAYTVVSIVPVVVLFLALQTRFIEGLTAGGLKG